MPVLHCVSSLREEMLLKVALLISLTILALVSNIFFYAFKLILRRNGYRTNFLAIGFTSDISQIKELIRDEPDENKKQGYKRLLVYLVLSSALFLVNTVAVMIVV